MVASPSLMAIFLCFFKVGCISFGGFMSLVSMIENNVVERRGWLSREDMLDGVALASLLPGPMAVNTVAYVGYRLRGISGALAGTTAVLIPTVLLMMGLTSLYFRFGELPQVERAFSGILPAVAAIVLSVCLRMRKSAVTNRVQWVALILAIGLLALVPASLKVYATFGLVFSYGLAGYLINRVKRERQPEEVPCVEGLRADGQPGCSWVRYAGFLLLAVIAVLGIVPLPVARDGIVALMTTFGSMSLTLFGGGYVFIPMIQEVVVVRFEWVTAQEFIDGIALGQITPGPILISAAFIGQKVAGISGALLSTVAIFAPPAILMVLLTGLLDRIRSSPAIQAVMKGIRIAVIALIFRAFLNIFLMAWPGAGGHVFAYVLLLFIFIVSFIALIRFKVDILWVIPVAGLLGYFLG